MVKEFYFRNCTIFRSSGRIQDRRFFLKIKSRRSYLVHQSLVRFTNSSQRWSGPSWEIWQASHQFGQEKVFDCQRQSDFGLEATLPTHLQVWRQFRICQRHHQSSSWTATNIENGGQVHQIIFQSWVNSRDAWWMEAFALSIWQVHDPRNEVLVPVPTNDKFYSSWDRLETLVWRIHDSLGFLQ